MRLAMTVSLPGELSSVTRARDILDVLLSLTAVTAECADSLAVVITEACANAVLHGAPGGAVDLTVTLEADTCTLEISNHGVLAGARFSTDPPDPAQPSGRGLLLIAALSDTAEFVPAPAGQISVRITRRLSYEDPTAMQRGTTSAT